MSQNNILTASYGQMTTALRCVVYLMGPRLTCTTHTQTQVPAHWISTKFIKLVVLSVCAEICELTLGHLVS